MENEKTSLRKGRPFEWYETVLRSIGSSIVNTNELSDILKKTDEKLGYNDWLTAKKSTGRDMIQSLLGKSRYEYAEDSSVKGRGKSKGFLFSLKLDKDETIDDLINSVAKKFEQEAKTSKKRSKKGLIETAASVASTTPSPKITPGTGKVMSGVLGAAAGYSPVVVKQARHKADRMNLYYLWKLVSTLYMRQQSSISLPYSFSLKAGEPITRRDLEDWVRSAGNYNIRPRITFSYSKGRNGKQFANFFDLPNLILTMSEKSKELGLDFDAKKVLNYKPLKESREEARKETPQLTDLEKNTVWISAGIIKQFGRAVDINDLCKTLRDKFNVKSCLRHELEAIFKKTPEIHLANTGSNLVSLNKALIGDDIWDVVIEKYSPKNVNHSVLARISMTLEELKYFFPKSEVVSRISDNEAIYKVVYDESESSKIRLLVLVLGFRGTDMLLDPELENKIKKELLPAVGQSLMETNPRLKIEHLKD